jgi:hypothetical protein
MDNMLAVRQHSVLGAAGSGAGESATHLTQAEGEMDNMLAVRQLAAAPWSS